MNLIFLLHFVLYWHLSDAKGTWLDVLYEKDKVEEVARDLQFSAQGSCLKDAHYTRVDTAQYFLDRSKAVVGDSILLTGTSQLHHSSSVVLSSFTTRDLNVIMNIPLAITHSNIGIAKGITNGTSKSVELAKVTKVNPMLPLHHPRQNMSNCASIAALVEQQPRDFYSKMKADYKLSYVRVLHNGIIHKDGFVALKCGWIQPRQGCSSRVLSNARTWHKNGQTRTISA
jgi:hypothetical protein